MDKTDKETLYLNGKLLLAMPGMGDPRFYKAVILVCAHDENGAMGLVLNHVIPGLDLDHLLSQLNIDLSDKRQNNKEEGPVMAGGPVETARGFVLHSDDFKKDDTVQINEKLGVTGTIDALKSIAMGDRPEQMLFILGYAGWSEGQLDREMQDNVWLIAEAESSLIFDTGAEEKWTQAVQNLGIDPAMLSGEAGRA